MLNNRKVVDGWGKASVHRDLSQVIQNTENSIHAVSRIHLSQVSVFFGVNSGYSCVTETQLNEDLQLKGIASSLNIYRLEAFVRSQGTFPAMYTDTDGF